MDNLVTSEYRTLDAFVSGNTEYSVEAKKVTVRIDGESNTIYKVLAFELLTNGTVKERTTVIYKGKNHAKAIETFKKLEEYPKGL